MEKKNTLILTIIAIATLIVVVIGATFAYFTATEDATQQIPVGVQTGDAPTFISSSNDPAIELNVTGDKMMEADSKNNPLVDSDTADLTVELTAATGTVCRYDIVYYNTGAKYMASEGLENINDGKEFTMAITKNGIPILAETNYDDNNVNFSAATSSTPITVLNGETISGNNDKVSIRYELTSSFYNLNIAQDRLMNQTFGGIFKVANVKCSKANTLSDIVLALAGENEYQSSQADEAYSFYSKYVVKQETFTKDDVTYDVGVRYEGSSPDNYIIYNDELWRIIGVFEGSTIGLETGKYYPKIIKDTSIIDMAMDTVDWTQSLVNSDLLNNYYIYNVNGFLNGLDDDARALIAKSNSGQSAQWHLGSAYFTTEEEFNSFLPSTLSDIYAIERGNIGVGGTNDLAKIRYRADIGLINASDWGYAAYMPELYGTLCDREILPFLSMGNLNESYCAYASWLTAYSGWTLLSLDSPLGVSGYVTVDNGYSNVINITQVQNEQKSIHPVLYLDYDIPVFRGNGSYVHPYILDESNINNSNLSDSLMLLSETDYRSSQDGSVYQIKHEQFSLDNQSYDAGYRYEGKDPNNYVYYDNSIWRIIGVFEGSTIGLEPNKYYTRIVSNDNDVMDWGWNGNSFGESGFENEFKRILENDPIRQENNELTLSTKGVSMIAKNSSGQSAQWHLGGIASNAYQSNNANQFYVAERGIVGAGSSPNILNVRSDLGLVYPSDYGYAMYGGSGTRCVNNNNAINAYSSSCYAYDWLYNYGATLYENGIWTMNSSSDNTTYVYAISNSGLINQLQVTELSDVLISLYLENDVYFTRGSGSASDPYVLWQ